MKSLHSRRDFLKSTSAIASAGLAVPYFFTAADAKAAASREKLGVAAIGVGGRGSQDAANAAKLGNPVACCDVHAGNARRFADGMSKHGRDWKVYTDYREMLDKEKGIDLVVIGTPDHWHVKIAIDAMKAGKHVYCEKPLTLTLAEGDIIQNAVRKYGKTFQVGTQQRSEFNMDFLKAVAIARSGRLGKNLSAVSSVGTAASRSPVKNKPFGPFPTQSAPTELAWDMWLGQASAVPFCGQRIGWNFRWWYEYSGGQVTDWGVHHTDIAFWALAGKDGHVVEAEALSSKPMGVELAKSRDFLLGKISPQDMPIAYNVAHEFDVDLKLSTGNTIKLISGKNELLIKGENGTIRVNRGSLTGKPVEEVNADEKAKKEIEALMAEIYGGSLPTSHMQNFFDCIETGRQPVANVFEHVRAVNACHFANIALLVGRKIVWDLGKQEFVNDAEANGLRSRKQRGPYGNAPA